jgi:hypothetical protein
MAFPEVPGRHDEVDYGLPIESPLTASAAWGRAGVGKSADAARHECLRHGAKQPNVKLFLRWP